MEERKKSDLPEKPKTPQQLWYNHEKKAYMKLHPEVPEPRCRTQRGSPVLVQTCLGVNNRRGRGNVHAGVCQ